MLIPDLYRIISEYTDPKTFMILKSQNISVISLLKYENLLSQNFKNIPELETLKTEHNQYKFHGECKTKIIKLSNFFIINSDYKLF